MRSSSDPVVNGSVVGAWITEPGEVVERERIVQYATATGERDERFLRGDIAPIMFGVVPSWELAKKAVIDAVAPDVYYRGVHGEHRVACARPLVPGDVLTSRAAAISIEPVRSGTVVVTRIESRDANDRLVLLQHSTAFFLGVIADRSYGTHTFLAPSDSGELTRLGVQENVVSVDRPALYADASGDRSVIHLDDEAARRLGLPGIILHGMCSMAMAGQCVAELAADGDGAALRELSCRFTSPVLPGTTLSVEAWQTTSGVGFTVTDSTGTPVMTHGTAAVGPKQYELEHA